MNIIKVNFLVASNDDFKAVKMIPVKVGNTINVNVGVDGYILVIQGLSRCKKRPRIHTFIATT